MAIKIDDEFAKTLTAIIGVCGYPKVITKWQQILEERATQQKRGMTFEEFYNKCNTEPYPDWFIAYPMDDNWQSLQKIAMQKAWDAALKSAV